MESTEREKKVCFAGVATQDHVTGNTEYASGVKSDHTSTGTNGNNITSTPDVGITNKTCHAIPSVSENLQKYNKRQIQWAEQAHTTSQTLGLLTVANFKYILQQNPDQKLSRDSKRC